MRNVQLYSAITKQQVGSLIVPVVV